MTQQPWAQDGDPPPIGGSGSAHAALPTFIIIGAQKSATRWLKTNLGHHREVFVAAGEPEFFNHHFHRGAEWYRSHFSDAGGAVALGEATPGYMMWREGPETIAARIRDVVPEVRLLAILRNPVDRAISAFCHHKRKGRILHERTLGQHVRSVRPEDDPLSVVSAGWYAASLQPYWKDFGQQLKVLFTEDIARRWETVFEEAMDHIGVAPDEKPASLRETLFSNRSEQVETEEPLRAADDEVESMTRRDLWKYFEDDVTELEALTGRDLSCWRGGL